MPAKMQGLTGEQAKVAKEAFEAVIAKALTAEALAKAQGIHKSAISRARKRGWVALPWVLPFERDYGIARHRLRPDVYPPPEPRE